MVEFMHSFEMLTKITADPVWADRAEEIAFNSLPAAITPDWKALHYLTAPNLVQLDRTNHSPGIQNKGTMLSFSPFEVYRCCEHNVSHGWPYYAEELWLATADHGLCASLFAASSVTAKVADGVTVSFSEETDYPFDDSVTFRITTPKPVRFPLYLRRPGWCNAPEISLGGSPVNIGAAPFNYVRINREWRNGDFLTLRLPMQVAVRKWEKNHGAVSVNYGPLSFSLKIAEDWKRYGGTANWPESEVFAATPWNYGLVLDDAGGIKNLTVIHKTRAATDNPFTKDGTWIELRALGARIPNWEMDRNGLAGKLQDSPVKNAEGPEVVELIPLGAARLRISMFPVIGTGPDAKEWTKTE
jgi:hypothetical protein